VCYVVLLLFSTHLHTHAGVLVFLFRRNEEEEGSLYSWPAVEGIGVEVVRLVPAMSHMGVAHRIRQES